MIKQVILKAALAAVLIGAASVARAQDPDVTGGTDNPAAAEPMSAIQTGRDIAKGIGEATVEVGGAVKSGGAGVMAQPRALWQDAVLPMLQRTTTALPTLIKALLLLIAFWIVARIAGGVVTKSLGLTKLDEKAAKDWGMDGMMKSQDGRHRSLEGLAGGAVKWVILLFGFVAFFNALELQMVAGPLQNIVDRIIGVVPNLLTAFVILFAYWVIASLVRFAITRGLSALKADERLSKFIPTREISGHKIGPSALAGRLLFYLILLFGTPPFLQALGQEALVAPLQDMLGKGLAFVPNVFAAALILFVGNLVAVIVREIVASFLAAAGADGLAERLNLGGVFGGKKLSGLVASIAYFFILVPIIISALDSLQIAAIADPVRATLEKVLAAVPAILVASVIVFIGYAVARFVRRLVETVLGGIGFDTLPARAGLDFLTPKSGATLSTIVGAIVMVVILLLTAQQALASLGFAQLASLLDRLVTYLPDLAVGLLILLAALSLARYVSGLVASATAASPYSRTLSVVANAAIIFLGAGMALDELGVSQAIVTTAVSAVLGSAALALGLAFGLGGRDKAKELIERKR